MTKLSFGLSPMLKMFVLSALKFSIIMTTVLKQKIIFHICKMAQIRICQPLPVRAPLNRRKKTYVHSVVRCRREFYGIFIDNLKIMKIRSTPCNFSRTPGDKSSPGWEPLAKIFYTVVIRDDENNHRSPVSGISWAYQQVFGFHDNYWRRCLGSDERRRTHTWGPEPKEDNVQEISYVESSQQSTEENSSNPNQDETMAK